MERQRLGRDTVLAIVAMALAVFVIANDFTALSVALPSIESDFDSDVSTVQWVVSAYALVFGVLIVPGGRLADMYGRTRILFVGAGIFAFFSLLGGVAPNIYLLIAARALMGIGGAMMWPAILGLIYAILPSSKAGLAGGLVLGVAGVGNAVGPLLGGALSQGLSWRWILLLNVPIAAVACLVTWRTVHVANPADHSRIDYLGTAALSVSLIALLIALTEAPDAGWATPGVIGPLVLSAIVMVAFVVREHRVGSAALIPGSVMRNRPFLYACLATLATSFTFFVSLLYLPQFFQKILDYGAFGSGAGLLPFMGVFAAASFSESWLLNRIGMKAVVTIGAACIFVGPLLFLAFLGPESGLLSLVPGMVVLGIGVGLFASSVTTAGLGALDPSQSSLAGGILYMFQIAGGAVGIGVATTVFLAASNREIDEGATAAGVSLSGAEREAIRGVVAGTDSSATVVGRYPGDIGTELVGVVRDSYAAGLRWAFVFVAVFGLIGLGIAVFRVAGPITRFGRDIGDPVDGSPPS